MSTHVYEKCTPIGIGSSVYNDQNYDTVYFDEESSPMILALIDPQGDSNGT